VQLNRYEGVNENHFGIRNNSQNVLPKPFVKKMMKMQLFPGRTVNFFNKIFFFIILFNNKSTKKNQIKN